MAFLEDSLPCLLLRNNSNVFDPTQTRCRGRHQRGYLVSPESLAHQLNPLDRFLITIPPRSWSVRIVQVFRTIQGGRYLDGVFTTKCEDVLGDESEVRGNDKREVFPDL